MKCKCGCGQEIIQKYSWYISLYICGHNSREKSKLNDEARKIQSMKKKGRKTWNTGLTKDTDERLRKGAIRMSEVKIQYMKNHKGPWKDTLPERVMFEGLMKRKFMVIKQYFIKSVGLVDFYLPELNMVIEVDGDYWHNRKIQIIKDKKRNKRLEELGYSLFRFWQSDIYKSLDNCLNSIGD